MKHALPVALAIGGLVFRKLRRRRERHERTTLDSANIINHGHVQQADLVERLQERVKALYLSMQSMQSMSAQMLL